MDYKLLIIPGAVIVFGIIFMIVMSARGNKSGGKAQDRMKDFAIQEYPCLKDAPFSVINLLEDAINAQHIWVVAYDKGGMRLIPATSNPFTQTLTKYEDMTPLFDWKKQLAANLFVGNKTEENEYIPYSAITSAVVDESRKKLLSRWEMSKRHSSIKRKIALARRRMKRSMRSSDTSKASEMVYCNCLRAANGNGI